MLVTRQFKRKPTRKSLV